MFSRRIFVGVLAAVMGTGLSGCVYFYSTYDKDRNEVEPSEKVSYVRNDVATTAGFTVGECGTTVPTDTPVGAMLELHNSIRDRVDDADPALPPLVWDECLAQQAAKWASRCDFRPDPEALVGENISARVPAAGDAKAALADWIHARECYTYPNDVDSCFPAREGCPAPTCGHYTQIVWRDTKAVGCARQVCNGDSPFKDSRPWEFWVCRYGPRGNILGRKPY